MPITILELTNVIFVFCKSIGTPFEIFMRTFACYKIKTFIIHAAILYFNLDLDNGMLPRLFGYTWAIL